MDVKGKLVELLYAADRECNNKRCETCKHQGKKVFCKIHFYVDHIISQGVTVQEWISVKDRLPPPYTPVLTYRQSFGKNPPYTKVDQMVLLYGDDKVWTDDLGTWKTVVTHWLPLPKPPKGE